MNGTEREHAVALLRAAADLLEGDPDVRAPYVNLHFTATGTPDPIASMLAIASGLPCSWQGSVRRNTQNDTDYYELRSTSPSGKTHALIDAHADEVCTPQGTRTVTAWAPPSAIAALLESTGDESEAGQ